MPSSARIFRDLLRGGQRQPVVARIADLQRGVRGRVCPLPHLGGEAVRGDAVVPAVHPAQQLREVHAHRADRVPLLVQAHHLDRRAVMGLHVHRAGPLADEVREVDVVDQPAGPGQRPVVGRGAGDDVLHAGREVPTRSRRMIHTPRTSGASRRAARTWRPGCRRIPGTSRRRRRRASGRAAGAARPGSTRAAPPPVRRAPAGPPEHPTADLPHRTPGGVPGQTGAAQRAEGTPPAGRHQPVLQPFDAAGHRVAAGRPEAVVVGVDLGEERGPQLRGDPFAVAEHGQVVPDHPLEDGGPQLRDRRPPLVHQPNTRCHWANTSKCRSPRVRVIAPVRRCR